MSRQFKLYVLVIFLFIGLFIDKVEADNPNDIYNKISPSVYQLYAIDKNREVIVGLGSSVAISKHFLATNCHVVLAGNFLIAKINDNPYLARLCYFNQEQDLCIIEVVGVDLIPVQIRKTKSVVVGEQVYAVAKMGKSGKLTGSHGKVTKITYESGYPILQTDAQTSLGSSGGGLFDANLNLIGLTTRGVPGTDIGYSISTELITEVVDPKNLPVCKLPQ